MQELPSFICIINYIVTADLANVKRAWVTIDFITIMPGNYFFFTVEACGNN